MSQLCEAQEYFDFKAEKVEVKKTVNIAIHDFTAKIDDQENKNNPIVSPNFKVGDNSFNVKVFPQGSSFMEYISVLFWNRKEKVTAATVTLKHASGAKWTIKNREIPDRCGMGDVKFLSHEAYKNWTKDHDDVFKVEVEITLHTEKPAQWTSTRVPKVKYDHVVEVSSLFNNDERLFTDFTILSKEGMEFPCHRFILSSRSQTMKAMMTTDMKEAKEGQMKLDYSDEMVEKFVDYFYTQTVPKEVLKNNVDSFMTLSELYDLTPLKHQTEEAACEQMTTDNMVDMFVLADLHSAENLKEASKLFIRENKAKLMEQDLVGHGYPAKVISDVLRLVI